MCECWQLSASVHSGSATSLSPPSSSSFFSSSARPRSRPAAPRARGNGSCASPASRRPPRCRARRYRRPRSPPPCRRPRGLPPFPRRARRPLPRRRGCGDGGEVRGLRQGFVPGSGCGPPALPPRGAGGEERPWGSPGRRGGTGPGYQVTREEPQSCLKGVRSPLSYKRCSATLNIELSSKVSVRLPRLER